MRLSIKRVSGHILIKRTIPDKRHCLHIMKGGFLQYDKKIEVKQPDLEMSCGGKMMGLSAVEALQETLSTPDKRFFCYLK